MGEVDDVKGVVGLRAMMVLLPLQVHLQNDVAEAVQERKLVVITGERVGDYS